jgi:hypothetical protein
MPNQKQAFSTEKISPRLKKFQFWAVSIAVLKGGSAA